MVLLLMTVFVASLVGSLHCAGMCGAFVAFAVGAGGGGQSKAVAQAAYHGGRLVVYVLLGTTAGFLGQTLDLGGALLGLQRTAAVAAGAMMVAFGVLTLLRVAGVKVPASVMPKVLQAWVTAGHRLALRLPGTLRAGAVGLLTALLPCGWLWAFVITAAGTGHPLTGAAAMAVFWAGTVPVLAALGVGVQKLAGAFAGKLPAVAAAAIVVVGLYTILTRNHAAAAIAGIRGPANSSATQCATQAAATTPACCVGRKEGR